MNEYYENIKNQTACSICGGTQMGFAYLGESAGAVKKRKEVMGVVAYISAGNMLMICCTTCGHVERSFVISK